MSAAALEARRQREKRLRRQRQAEQARQEERRRRKLLQRARKLNRKLFTSGEGPQKNGETGTRKNGEKTKRKTKKGSGREKKRAGEMGGETVEVENSGEHVERKEVAVDVLDEEDGDTGALNDTAEVVATGNTAENSETPVMGRNI